ncbi:MAG: Gfo/Idh/MocA family oxidoreductase [Acidobacteria bacterium]|nr:Gfo/Idh/MocA family oxidoreductase [Acidobacteriota bacterium]
MQDNTRRTFIRTAGATMLASQWSRVLGANDRVNVAVIGLGGRGRSHVNEYGTLQSECNIAGVCDVDQASLERGEALVQKLTGQKPKGFSDMRRAFDDKDIDAVSMPLPNHWHALATIWACQAGKDVYVEKPASHNVFEGQMMTAAARKYKRMVQIGSQSRSIPHKMKAMSLLHSGAIGKVYLAKGLCFKRRKSIGKKPDGPVPPGVNWDFFLGPAPMRAFNENRFKYNWHWFWDTGNGDIGNQGVHEMDIARWGLGVDMPLSVVSTGGKFAYDDDQETPNTQLASFDYGQGRQLVFEVRGLLTGTEGGLGQRGGNCIGNLFYGSEGWMSVDGGGFKVYKGETNELAMEEEAAGRDTAVHMQNFFKAVKSRNHNDLGADVEVGAVSAALCHLANISYRVGRKLNFDPRTQKFTGDAEANKMLTRDYRKPYVITEKV